MISYLWYDVTFISLKPCIKVIVKHHYIGVESHVVITMDEIPPCRTFPISDWTSGYWVGKANDPGVLLSHTLHEVAKFINNVLISMWLKCYNFTVCMASIAYIVYGFIFAELLGVYGFDCMHFSLGTSI